MIWAGNDLSPASYGFIISFTSGSSLRSPATNDLSISSAAGFKYRFPASNGLGVPVTNDLPIKVVHVDYLTTIFILGVLRNT